MSLIIARVPGTNICSLSLYSKVSRFQCLAALGDTFKLLLHALLIWKPRGLAGADIPCLNVNYEPIRLDQFFAFQICNFGAATVIAQ